MTRNKIAVLLTTLLLCTLTASAQEGLLGKAKRYIDSANGLQVEFELTMDGETSQGAYYALGEAFYLETDGLKAWHSDGSLWVYLSVNNEISLTHPHREDLLELNPLLNLDRISDKTFTVTETKAKGVTTVKAAPKEREEVEWIMLTVDTDGKPLSLRVKQRSLEQPVMLKVTHLSLTTSEVMKQKDFFRYTQNKMPGVAVIDLR
ncbi:MAG: LolA-like putative outer membrane lipoprotein chaperone [Porphyromonas sp.]|nr:LolA-like putative outer membrane lipoprotein chaperone [Porphyromonas sp.]